MTPRTLSTLSFRATSFRRARSARKTVFPTLRHRPLTRAIALVLASSGVWSTAYAQQAFSNAWFAARGAAQTGAAQTGRLPNGMPVASLMNPSAQQQQANAQLQRSIANLGTAAQNIAAMQAAQANARAAAANADATLPDGLAEGGLKVDTSSLTKGWINAKAPTQTTANGKTSVNVEQTADKAILNWETFNVGRNTSLNFQQQSQWAVLNRVNDPQARPSQIQGQIHGDGTVLVVNRNGVIFGGSSQVDTRNLVVAAAKITDAQFQTGGIYGANGTTPTFTEALGRVEVQAGANIATRTPTSVTQGGGYVLMLGKEVSNAGTIVTPQGQVALAAGDSFVIRKGVATDANTASTTRGSEISPQFVAQSTAGKVVNSGLLMAPEGDVTLAGRDVRQLGVAVSTTTVNTRGTIHLLNSASDSQGTVTIGSGSLTSVLINDNGAVALDSQRAALVQESAAKDAVRAGSSSGLFDNLSVLADRRDQSRVEIVSGGTVEFQGDSLTLATGGQIAVSAARRSFVANRALLDVSGAVGVSLSMDSNNVKVNVQGNEQRDAPGNRDNAALNNANLWIDRRRLVYVPATVGGYANERWYTDGGLLEVGGYLANQGHRIGEWAAQGGTVTLGGSQVVTQTGANINLSGGTLDVQTGFLNQTWLRGADGQIYNANTAPADIIYEGVYTGFDVTHPRWGKNTYESYANPLIAPTRLLQNGYTVGRDAGRLIVTAPTAVLEGDVTTTVYNGPSQTASRVAGTTDGYVLSHRTAALPGALIVGQVGGFGLTNGFASDIRLSHVADISAQMSANDVLSAERIGTVWLDVARLNAQQLGGLTLVSTKGITLDAPLVLADGGQLTLTAANVDVDAGVTARAGAVTLGNVMHGVRQSNRPEEWWQLNNADGSSHVTLGDGAIIDLRGRWTNAPQSPTLLAGMPYLDGGTFTADATGSIALRAGSVIDVSSGGAILPNGKLTGGKGGSVKLVSNDFYRFTPPTTPVALTLDGTLRAYGFAGGGTLTIQAGQAIAFGPTTDAAALALPVSLLQSGFTNYDITGMSGVNVASGTVLRPTVPVYRVTDALAALPTGAELTTAAELWLPPVFNNDAVKGQQTQRVGADLTLTTTRGDFHLMPTAAIEVDPGRNVNLYAFGQTTLEGSVTARGGNITVASARELTYPGAVVGGIGGYSSTRSIWVGENAVLDVSGLANTAVDQRGRHYGSVSDGGTLRLGAAADGIAGDAFIVVRPGARLNASGASGVIDVVTGTVATPMQVASNGGTIALSSNSGFYLDGEMVAAAGGANAFGGTLSLNLVGRFYGDPRAGSTVPDSIGAIPDEVRRLRNITLTQHREANGLASDLKPGQADAALNFGQATLSADQVAQGGFASLALQTSDLFVFKGDVNLSLSRSLSLSGGILSVAPQSPDIRVALAAPYVRIDGFKEQQAGLDRFHPGLNNIQGPSLTKNNSVFSVTSDLIDVNGTVRFGVHGHQGSGALVIGSGGVIAVPSTNDGSNRSGGDIVDAAGFGKVELNSRGDIRFGTSDFRAPGDIAMTASQIYPLSGQMAGIYAGQILRPNDFGGVQPGDAYDNTLHSIVIRRNDGPLPAQPASAFGVLSLIAPIIDQGGVVRAPLGTVNFNLLSNTFTLTPPVTKVIFRAGSVTSASAAGLVMPYGGTADGTTYSGVPTTLVDLGSTYVPGNAGLRIGTGIAVSATSAVAEAGSLLDVSGGGDLLGAGFVSGRGGSVDVLKTSLANANPANAKSSTKNGKVYAIVPGFASAYAPMIASNGAGDPAIGQQITIPAGVAGLEPGTYTLLPSSYAMLPGAFRVELGNRGTQVSAPSLMPNGSWRLAGNLGTANTGVSDALPTQLIVTSGKVLRTYAKYNETSYADFARTQAAQFGNVRPRLPIDGKTLQFDIGASDGVTPSLSFAGNANFSAVGDGVAGSLLVTSSAASGIIDITPRGAAATVGHSVIASEDLNEFRAPTMFIGGGTNYVFDQSASGDGTSLRLLGSSRINLLDGAVLKAGTVFLVGSDIHLARGAGIDTRGLGNRGLSSSTGYVFGSNAAVLVAGNGWYNFLPVGGTNTMSIDSGASITTEGGIVLASPGALNIGDVDFGARYITVSQDRVNLGDAASLAAAKTAGVLPAGWSLDQSTLDRLLRPSTVAGAPSLERLTLTAGGSFNIFGSVSLDARARGANAAPLELVLNTPAIYGAGAADSVASIVADRFIWNGIRTVTTRPDAADKPVYGSKAPAAVTSGGAGSGRGSLSVQAGTIAFGYDENSRPTDGATLDRIALGFGDVTLSAGKITVNSDGTLSVGLQKDAAGVLSGGNLRLVTPLVTADNGASIAFKAGGDVRVTAPASGPGNPASINAYGGTVTIAGANVVLDTTFALPGGRLAVAADKDITLGDSSIIDLSGRAIPFFDTVKYGWGGDLILQSAHGNITQTGGSLIDVSALHNDAGTLTAIADDAANGRVALNGRLRGSTTSPDESAHLGGQFNVRAQSVGDFAALNRSLNAGGFFGARNIDLKQGDLVIDDEMKARSISISVDGGSLTVNGRMDATGVAPGTIRLAARDNLLLTSNAVLDARGTRLQTDSYGAPIEANNVARIELTTSQGGVTLSPGATLDMRSPDNVARGKLSVNVPRRGGVGGDGDGANDIAINAAGPIVIRGAASIAVNGFRNYSLPGGSVIDQAYLDTVDVASRAFITAALGNADLQARLAGLRAYDTAFHLRPGVDIHADGNLTVSGDIDLSGYRYGPGANPAIRGSGEPGVLRLRASGNLDIKGSLNDGFALPPGTPDDGGWIVMRAGLIGTDLQLSKGIILGAGSTFPVDSVLGYNIPLLGAERLDAGTPAAKTFKLLAGVVLPAGYVLGKSITVESVAGPGQTLTEKLDTLFQDTYTQADWYIAPGSPEGNYFDQLLGGLGAGITYPDGEFNLVKSGMTVPKGSMLAAFDFFFSLPQGFVVPPAVFPNGLIIGSPRTFAEGTRLQQSLYMPGGTQIPVGFKLPQTVVMQTGATLRANVLIPQSVTLGADITVPSAFVAASEIKTPTMTFAAGSSVPAGTLLPYGTSIAAGNTLPFDAPLSNTNWAAGNALHLTGDAMTSADVVLGAGKVLPGGTFALGAGGNTTSIGSADGKNWAVAPMLQAGSQSWSISLASGADLFGADPRLLRTAAQLQGAGNLTLDDPHYAPPKFSALLPSVIRTGTGDLELLAGGDYVQKTPFGVYTAGTAIAGTGTAANAAFNVGRGTLSDGTVLGADNAAYEAALNAQRMYYTEHGGDLTIQAQGDIGGYTKAGVTDVIGNWLWRQGGAELGQSTAWGINFGSYVADVGLAGPYINLDAFTGMGTLGGGKVTLRAGRDIGNDGQAVVVAVGASGRVLADGTLVQTGGGALSVTAGRNVGTGGNQFVNVRGDTVVNAGKYGTLTFNQFGNNGPTDPRPMDTLKSYGVRSQSGGALGVGDGTMTIRTRADLAMGTIDDPGRVGVGQQTDASALPGGGQGASWFTLWTDKTAVDMFSAGGNVSPLASGQGKGISTVFLPPVMRAVAGAGSLFVTPSQMASFQMPSIDGELEFLAGNSVIQQYVMAFGFGPLASSTSSLATPFRPGWVARRDVAQAWKVVGSNVWGNPNQLGDAPTSPAYDYDSISGGYSPNTGHVGQGGTLFAFGPNTVTDRSAAGDTKSRIYAVNGDVTGLHYGEIYTASTFSGGGTIYTDYYRAGKAVDILAGGDIVNLTGLILHDKATDTSTIAASRDIIYAGYRTGGGESSVPGLQIAGPGTLELTAGRNLYEGYQSSIESIGSLIPGSTAGGAGVVLQAGVGAGVPGVGAVNWDAFANLYLVAANQLTGGTLGDQKDKVVKTYQGELGDWLKGRYGYAGSDALTYFKTLPAAEQRVFLRQVYYAELRASGREYNDSSSPRFASYLRGRRAIDALFPQSDGAAGDITMFSSRSPIATSPRILSGSVHTDFGGDIQLLAPRGSVTIGTEGLVPDAGSGLVTQGNGDIQVYSKGSLLLGLSRMMTTFGGSVLAWSAEGDINAGRGAKTTVLYTPPKRVYDDTGNVTLSPQVPSSGAGIATLAPIPEVPPGDIDLIAPLGTVDAGEAGIRFSGNINVAALQVMNAANIVGTGKSTGLPTIAAVNIGALTNASATSAQAAVAAQEAVSRERVAQRQGMPSVFTVRMLTTDADSSGNRSADPQAGKPLSYRPESAVQVLGDAHLGAFARGQLTAAERKSLGL